MTKPKTWSYDQQIQFELANDTITSLQAILLRQSWVIDDEVKKEVLQTRAVELYGEMNNYNGFDDEIVKDVIDTYSALIREYHTMGTSEEEIAAKGLPDKFITTRVKYEK